MKTDEKTYFHIFTLMRRSTQCSKFYTSNLITEKFIQVTSSYCRTFWIVQASDRRREGKCKGYKKTLILEYKKSTDQGETGKQYYVKLVQPREGIGSYKTSKEERNVD